MRQRRLLGISKSTATSSSLQLILDGGKCIGDMLRINWKILCSFGLVFWVCMCVVEYVFGNIIRQGEFSAINDLDLEIHDDKPKIPESTFNWQQTMLWSVFSFTSSLGICFLTKVLKANMKAAQVNDEPAFQATPMPSPPPTPNQFANELRHSSSKSKIPVIVTESLKKVTPTPSQNPVPTNLVDVVKDFPVTIENKDEVLIEKRCSKLKDEIVDLQYSTWKEYSVLVKKLDSVSKDKKDLQRQLVQSQKDHTTTKQQLDDILNDRSLLIKRLECATREIKLNTATKQMTLDKLEEAIGHSNRMKERIARLIGDKEKLEGKLRFLEGEYNSLHGNRSRLSGNVTDSNHKYFPPTETASEMIEESEKEFDISQSDKDIQQVQIKLFDLEKSLEKMRLGSTEDFGVCESKESFDDESKIDARSGDESTPNNVEFYYSKHVSLEGTRNELNCTSMIEYKESTSSTSTTSEEVTTVSETVTTDSDDVFNRKGVVSKSPEFQQFLYRILENQKIDAKKQPSQMPIKA